MTNAVLYARFSPRPTFEAQNTETIDLQFERLRAYCIASDWTVLQEERDEEISAGSMESRPGLAAALDMACRHKCVLAVYSLSRLCRNTQDALAIVKRLSAAGAELASLNEKVDTTTPMGKFTFTVMAAVAQLEREQTSQRTSDAICRYQKNGWRMTPITRRRKKGEAGAPVNCLPYGWRLDVRDQDKIVRDVEEQKIIRRIMSMWQDGLGVSDIATALTEANVPTRSGNRRWHHETVRRIVKKNTVEE